MIHLNYYTKNDIHLVNINNSFYMWHLSHAEGLESKTMVILKAQFYKPNAVEPNCEVVGPGARKAVLFVLDFLWHLYLHLLWSGNDL